MTRLAVLFAVALASSSCASPPRLLPGKSFEWKPNEFFKVNVELQEQPDWAVQLDMTSRLGPCVGYRDDGTLEMEATFTLEDGTEVKGKPKRVTPELGGGGVFDSKVIVPVPMAGSTPKLLKLRVHGQQETYRVIIDVY